MTTIKEVGVVGWVRSSRCDSGYCVEVATYGGRVLVRDAKDQGGPVLNLTPGAWAAFLAAVRADTFGGGTR